MARAPGRFEPLHGHEGGRQQFQLDTSQAHCRSSDLGGCPWLVLACLGLSCLRYPEKNLFGA